MYQKSLIILKPDALQRRLTGRIIQRFEDVGLKIHAMKLVKVGPDQSKRHYAEHVEKDFYPSLESYITSNPVLMFILGGLNANSKIRLMVGDTMPANAIPGTIRGDLAHQPRLDSTDGADMQPLRNLIHASANSEDATHEISVWFSDNEIEDLEQFILSL